MQMKYFLSITIILSLISLSIQRQFLQDKLVLDGSKFTSHREDNHCWKFEVESNNSQVKFTLENPENDINDFLISNKNLLNMPCNYGNLQKKCNGFGQDALCEYRDTNSNNEDYQKEVVTVIQSCHEKLYIYIETQLGSAPFSVKAEKVDGGKSCDKQGNNEYLACSQVDPKTCSSSCVTNCKHLACFDKSITVTETTLLSELPSPNQQTCVPVAATTFEMQKTCGGVNIDQLFATNKCLDKFEKAKTILKESDPWMDMFIFVMIIWLVSICVYRYKLNKDGKAPFDAPGCCPEICYPREPEYERDSTYNLSAQKGNVTQDRPLMNLGE